MRGDRDRIAVVVLAAGASTRMEGEVPKQLLDWHGVPMVRHVAEVALAGDLGPVIVVVGAHADEVRDAVRDLDVCLVVNDAWSEGQSTSVRAGLARLPDDVGAAVFLPCDQPGVRAHHLQRIAGPWKNADPARRPAAVVPFYRGHRGAPVLFERRIFLALEGLAGDHGGRVLLDDLGDEVETVEIDDPWAGRDVDTLEEYEQLVARRPAQ